MSTKNSYNLCIFLVQQKIPSDQGIDIKSSLFLEVKQYKSLNKETYKLSFARSNLTFLVVCCTSLGSLTSN
jgi:hypothetical protein